MAQFLRNVFCEYTMCTGATDERATLNHSIVSDGRDLRGRPSNTYSILKPLKSKPTKVKHWGEHNFTFKLQSQNV